MGIREKLRRRAQPFLEDGESIEHIFPVLYGALPWVYALGAAFGVIGALLMMMFSKARTVVITDRSVVLLTAGIWLGRPKGLLVRLPRDTEISPVRGKIWGKVEIGGVKFYVHRRFFKDVPAA